MLREVLTGPAQQMAVNELSPKGRVEGRTANPLQGKRGGGAALSTETAGVVSNRLHTGE